MSDIKEYKCPCCGGSIEYNATEGEMKCPFCDTTFEAETLENYAKELENDKEDSINWDTEVKTEWAEGEADNIGVYFCRSCGGEIIADENTGATECPFCGNPVVLASRFSGELKPDLVIPFKLDKKQAKEMLKKHLTGKKLLPKLFKDENHIEEIKGVYVPFWLFNADANADMRFKATRLRTWSDRNYIYTERSYFSVYRSGALQFENIPADGSAKIADELMESIEPYDFSEAVDFTTAYLSGFLADKYDVPAEDTITRVNQRVKNSTERAMTETVEGYTSVEPQHSNVSIDNGSVKYALLPVWLLTTKWENNTYTFAMNAQTGKFVGNLPMDKKAYWKYFGIYAGIASVIAFLIFLLFFYIF